MKKNTKIVCTLGPSSDDISELEPMIIAGMNVARLNFSHGDYEHMKKIFANLRKAEKNTGKTIAILQDLQGPKIRLGLLPEQGVPVKHGQRVIFSTGTDTFKPGPIATFPVQYKNLHNDVKKGDLILVDDGYFELKVEKKDGRNIYCHVQNGGVFKSHKGINCPTASISAKALSTKDKEDLAFGVKQGIDYVALSFVKNAKDIEELRALLVRYKAPHVKIIAKIERREAIEPETLEAIAQAADGLMVARGDLGIEIPAEQVPIVQKEIVRYGLLYAKPVIIATQILESMIKSPRATRAEISDAATAIFEHADALMLSGETSVGDYPVEAVRTLSKVARATEHALHGKEHLLSNHLVAIDMHITDATCYNAALLAKHIQADCIVVLTRTGYTARQIMKHRPSTPTIVITYDPQVKKELELIWGLNDILVLENRIESAAEAAKRVPSLLKPLGVIKPNRELVIVNAGKRHNFITTVVV
ncbi:MAG: pyruvate kinase [Candidatus Gracilibacteria bacterium]